MPPATDGSWTTILSAVHRDFTLRARPSSGALRPVWMPVHLVAIGLSLRADIEDGWFAADLHAFAGALEHLAASGPEERTAAQDGGRGLTLRLSGVDDPAVPNEVVASIWITASGDDPSSSLTVSPRFTRDELREGAGRSRRLAETL